MKRKILFGYDYTDNELVKVLLYLLVGGTAALVEWALFYIFFMEVFPCFGFAYGHGILLATASAFCIATLFHYFLGNVLVFDSGSKFQRSKELSLVFLVSVVGLGFNLILMYLFADVFKWHPMASKVLTSCIVVVWNYLSRKKWIFRS